MRDDAPGPLLRRLAPMIYGPTLLYALGEGAVLPVLPMLAARLGADVAMTALVVSALVVGQVCGNLPAGWLVARIGERLTMTAAAAVTLLALAGLVWAPSLAVFSFSVFVVGVCAAAFGLARHAFMTTRVPLAYRARALSLLGGTFRLGMFIGPFVAAALLAMTSVETTAVWLFALCLLATMALVLFGPDPETVVASGERSAGDTRPATSQPPTGVIRTMVRHRGILLRLGLSASCLSGVRATRQLILPLWGVSIGLDAPTIALVMGISGAIDFALFYASGQVMDRFGRLWAALPALVLMGAGFVALSLTHDLGNAAGWFALLAAVLGLGNGLSSGILLTLGADLAPVHNPAPFLGSWRALTDAGGAATPLLVSALTALVSLPVAVGAVGAVALMGAAGFLRWVPRFVPRPARAEPRPDPT